MWEDYSNKVNELYNKLDKLQSNKVENKIVVQYGNNGRYNKNKKEDAGSLAENMSNTLQSTYGYGKK